MNIEKELLEGLYWGNQYTQKEIGYKFGIHRKTIEHKMREYNIPTRNREIIIEKDLIKALYWGNGYSQQEIGNMFGVHCNSIYRKMMKYNIPSHYRYIPYIEKELLEGLYLGNRYSIQKIAGLFNIATSAAHNKLRKYNIPTRSLSEAGKGIHQNENNGNWKGEDVGYFPMHIWIRRRKEKPDKCVMCGVNPPRDLANLSGEYRRDVRDYIYVCSKCHKLLDMKLMKSRVGYEKKKGETS